MTTSKGRRNRWLLALGALAVATNGCSALIAHRGVRSVGEIYKPETRAEVRAAFGEADETRTSPDGRTVERRTIRQRVPWVCEGPGGEHVAGGRCEALGALYVYTLGLVDVFVIPAIVYRSEQAKLQYVFVYGADDRVLCRYDVTHVPSSRFCEAIRPLTESLSLQLSEGGCPSWEACLSAFAAEVRQHASCVEYSLIPQEEETLHRVQALGADVDAGRLAPDDTLAKLQWGLGGPPWSCLRP